MKCDNLVIPHKRGNTARLWKPRNKDFGDAPYFGLIYIPPEVEVCGGEIESKLRLYVECDFASLSIEHRCKRCGKLVTVEGLEWENEINSLITRGVAALPQPPLRDDVQKALANRSSNGTKAEKRKEVKSRS